MENKQKKWIAGVLTGVAAGTILALIIYNNRKDLDGYGKLLLKKGTKLAKKGGRLSSDLKDKFGEFIDQVEDRFHSALS